jgi:hypothetical protein
MEKSLGCGSSVLVVLGERCKRCGFFKLSSLAAAVKEGRWLVLQDVVGRPPTSTPIEASRTFDSTKSHTPTSNCDKFIFEHFHLIHF